MAEYVYPESFTHIFAIGVILAFLDAYSIGANDVANSFANAVASGTLKLYQACIIACFTEFLGALLLGKATGETLRGKIINPVLFADNQGILMLAMQCSLLGSSSFVLFATHLGWPVSTTHAIVGAVIGTGIASFGSSAINWTWDNNGVAQIVASWFISPALAAGLALVLFLTIKYGIMRRTKCFLLGLIFIPIFISITFFINVYFIVTKGMPKLDLRSKYTEGQLVAMSWAVGIGMGVILGGFMIFFGKRVIAQRFELQADGKYHRKPKVAQIEEGKIQPVDALSLKSEFADGKIDADDVIQVHVMEEKKKDNIWMRGLNKVKRAALHGVEVDVTSAQDKEQEERMNITEKFDERTEELFKLCQVASSCFASFAHGSNDVANAVGPFATIYAVWSQGSNYMCLGMKNGRCWTKDKFASDIETWILAFGGASIVIGLSTYGYNIMRSLGNHMTLVSPSRGFCMELGATISILFASSKGWPVSTTHCITGSTAAVGAASGLKSVNWKLLAVCFFGWIVTLPCAGLTAGLILAYVGYAPNLWNNDILYSITF
mmetsp:Transcript_24617/g.42376  ORF Transcript_24617/g.42376 Transcript_24617/m.42376 type:complete len:550 (+) Transcript_24617:75-1724(+)